MLVQENVKRVRRTSITVSLLAWFAIRGQKQKLLCPSSRLVLEKNRTLVLPPHSAGILTGTTWEPRLWLEETRARGVHAPSTPKYGIGSGNLSASAPFFSMPLR